MSGRHNARPCRLHQLLRAMQRIHSRFAGFHHRRHLLPLQIVHRVRRNGRTHRQCRSLVFLASFLVRGGVERNEEDEVGAQSCATGECSEFFSSARSGMRKCGKKSVCVIIVRSKVHKT